VQVRAAHRADGCARTIWWAEAALALVQEYHLLAEILDTSLRQLHAAAVDLSAPLCSLVPSLDSATLEVLAGTESGLSVSQIARLANRGSRQGHTAVLDRLVDHGLVTADRANQGYLYKLNRQHVLADAVLSAYGARPVIISRLVAAVEGLSPRPVHASLFGSFARREAGPASDIDLLLVFSDSGYEDQAWPEQVQELAGQVLSWTGNRLEYIVLAVAELHRVAKAVEPIVESWRTDALVLHGDDLEFLLASMRS
jgi:hypothetical protein